MRAWVVTSPDEERSIVVMARCFGEAIRLGASELESDTDGATARREPKWDGVRPGRAALLADGWHFDCYCGHQVRSDGCGRCSGSTAAHVVGEDVYCSPACETTARERERDRR